MKDRCEKNPAEGADKHPDDDGRAHDAASGVVRRALNGRDQLSYRAARMGKTKMMERMKAPVAAPSARFCWKARVSKITHRGWKDFFGALFDSGQGLA